MVFLYHDQKIYNPPNTPLSYSQNSGGMSFSEIFWEFFFIDELKIKVKQKLTGLFGRQESKFMQNL